MNDLFEGGTLELNSPITEEQWDMLTDVDFDHTPSVTFHTKHGKDVEFVKVVRCEDCKHYKIWQLKADYTEDKRYKPSVCTIGAYSVFRNPDWFCADGDGKAEQEADSE